MLKINCISSCSISHTVVHTCKSNHCDQHNKIIKCRLCYCTVCTLSSILFLLLSLQTPFLWEGNGIVVTIMTLQTKGLFFRAGLYIPCKQRSLQSSYKSGNPFHFLIFLGRAKGSLFAW